MRKSIAKIRGLGFILWHARHEFYHLLLGALWAWFLREMWGQFNVRWIFLSLFASLLPDAEHFLYFFTYGRKDEYTRKIASHIRSREWRMLTTFVEEGHKFQTELKYHNIYVIALLAVLVGLAWVFSWEGAVIIAGAMILHYLFDIADDFVTLGYLNENWRRWGNGRRRQRTS